MPGPFYREIKESDTFEFNGTAYNSSDFLSEDKPEKEIVVIPDTRYFNELADFVKNSNIIITECTYLLKEDAHHARKNYHLSIVDIEKMIAESKVESLFLTHISARYDKNIENGVIETLSGICNVRIAHDLEEFSL